MSASPVGSKPFPIDHDQFLKDFKAKDTQSQLLCFSALVKQDGWVLDNAKLCKRVIKEILKATSKNSCPSLDKVIKKTLTLLNREEDLKFQNKLLPLLTKQALSKSRFFIVQERLLNPNLSDTAISSDDFSFFFQFCAEQNRHLSFSQLKQVRPSSFHRFVSNSFPILLKNAVSNGSVEFLQCLDEIVKVNTLCTLKVPLDNCPSTETLLHLAAYYNQLKVLQWFSSKYPTEFQSFLEQQSLTFFQAAAQSGSAAIFEWMETNYLEISKESFKSPTIIQAALPFASLLEWIDLRYPDLITLTLNAGNLSLDRASVESLKFLKRKNPSQFQKLFAVQSKELLPYALQRGHISLLEKLKEIDSKQLTENLEKEENLLELLLADDFTAQSFEWVLVNFPNHLSLKNELFKFLLHNIQECRSHFNVIAKHCPEIILSNLQAFGDALKSSSLKLIQEIVQQVPCSSEADKIRLRFHATIPWININWHYHKKEILEEFKTFLKSPHLTSADFKLSKENIVHEAAQVDDEGLLSLFYEQHPDFFIEQANTPSRTFTQVNCLLHFIAKSNAKRCAEWICRTLPNYVAEHLDMRPFLEGRTFISPLEMASKKGSKETLDIFSSHFPQVIEFRSLLEQYETTDLGKTEQKKQLASKILAHPLFTLTFIKGLQCTDPHLLEGLLEELCSFPEVFNNYKESIKEEIISLFVSDEGSIYYYLRESLIYTPTLPMIERVHRQMPDWPNSNKLDDLFVCAARDRNLEVLQWMEAKFPTFIQERFQGELPFEITSCSSISIWQWAFEQAPREIDIDQFVYTFITVMSDSSLGISKEDLAKILFVNLKAADFNNLFKKINNILINSNENEKAMGIINLIPPSLEKLKNELTLMNDLKMISNLLSQIELETVPNLTENSPSNRVMKRFKEIFSSENKAYLEYALPHLLANHQTLQYLLNSNSSKIAELISLAELNPEEKLNLLPLLPPSEMVQAIDQLLDSPQSNLLQEYISVPQLIEGIVTVLQAIEMGLTNWGLQAQSSEDSASTYAHMLCSLLRSMPFKTIAMAARSPLLQDKMIAALLSMSPEQQAVIIPQVAKDKLNNDLKRFSITHHAVILSMATRSQKIFYLQSLQENEFVSSEFQEIARAWQAEKAALKAEIEAFAKRSKADPKNREDFTELEMRIAGKMHTVNFALQAEKTKINQLIDKLEGKRESSEELTNLIETKLKAVFSSYTASLESNSLKVSLDEIAEKFELTEEIPVEYVCPISQELMIDPVEASDHKVYDRKSIEEWLKEKSTSPITREAITNDLIPREDIRNQISDWKSKSKKAELFSP